MVVKQKNLFLAPQFDDLRQQKEAVHLGLWAFLVTEVMFFGGFFTMYSIYRGAFPVAFQEASHHLDITMGGINTVVLIGSSLTMALAVYCAQMGKNKLIALFLGLTVVLGTIFLGIKGIEYSHKFHEHLVPGPYFHSEAFHFKESQLFFSLYFAMTGMHAIHMIIGIPIIVVYIFKALRNRFAPTYFAPIELLGLYWHFVDIVWIFLFPLFYLVGRH